jgi:hypothetical protein
MAIQEIRSVDYLSALKVGAIGGLIAGILMGLYAILMVSIVTMVPGMGGMAAGLGIVGFVGSIIAGLIGGAIYGVVLAAIYNLIIVKLVGGLKIDLQ